MDLASSIIKETAERRNGPQDPVRQLLKWKTIGNTRSIRKCQETRENSATHASSVAEINC